MSKVILHFVHTRSSQMVHADGLDWLLHSLLCGSIYACKRVRNSPRFCVQVLSLGCISYQSTHHLVMEGLHL